MRFPLALLLLFYARPLLAIDSPLEIGNRAQICADRTWIDWTSGVDFVQHPGTKDSLQPVLKADQPWEGWRVNIYGTVLYDSTEQFFKMWYVTDATADFPNYATCYATSRDGKHWEKPFVGTVPSALGLRKHNVVADACLLPSVMKDAAEADPARRYKMVCWVQKPKPAGGPHTFVSPDGLHWTRLSKEPICRSNDVITAYYDPQRKLYTAFPKLSTAVRGGPVRRCFALSTSRDFLTWTQPRYILVPDQRDDAGSLQRIEEVRDQLDVPDDPALMRTEFYGMGVYLAESCTVGFPWVFTINNNARYGNHEGPGEIQLAVSRDSETWQRPMRQPIVPHGKPGEWDCGFLSSASQAIRVNDEVWLYYGGANYTHGTPCLYRAEDTGRGTKYTCGMGLVRWKLDRFVSADADQGGVLKTMPLVFAAGRKAETTGQPEVRLEVNAEIKESIQVVLLDLKGGVLATSKPVSGDSLRHVVEWKEPLDLGSLAGKALIVRFEMNSAGLYGFAFR